MTANVPGTVLDIAEVTGRAQVVRRDVKPGFRTGFCTIVGAPNAGKSTLMNRMIGEKLSIVTPKAQTTRHRIMGIATSEDYQIVYSDTPGVMVPAYEMQQGMMNFVREAIGDADVLLFLTDIFEKQTPDPALLQQINEMVDVPLIAAINKIDLLSAGLSDAKKQEVGSLESIVEQWKVLLPRAEILPISALEGINTGALLTALASHLPEGAPLYDKDTMSDKPMRFFASEIIREKIFLMLGQELPYCSEVVLDTFIEKPGVIVLKATIMVARDSQKGIVIGKGGCMVRELGTAARQSLEEFFDSKVFLDLNVKVDKNWRSKPSSLRAYGYLK